jgi:hypothetical protein
MSNPSTPIRVTVWNEFIHEQEKEEVRSIYPDGIHPRLSPAYDLVATLPSGARRIQVKSSTHRDRSGTWRVGLGQRPYVLDKTARRIPYDPDEVDDFFIVDGDGVLYLVPSSVVAGRTAIHVGPYRAYRVGDASSLLQATMSGH